MLRATARRHRRKEAAEMNITAFMNLMVILVPFLLISAVFSRLTILQLNLPGESSGAAETQQVLNIEVIVRKEVIEVADRGTGVLRTVPIVEGAYDLKGLSDYLQLVKSKYPDNTEATILLEQEIRYDTLVKVMDTVRVFQVPGSQWDMAELFPDVSVGDAPT